MIIKEMAKAKINLCLHVGEKRTDGYHSLDSIMSEISLCDTVKVEFSPADRSEISLCCTLSDELAPLFPDAADKLALEKNIAYLAADAYLRAAGICGKVKINIEKNIPLQAGMGGGSADAAAVIRAMNALSGKALCDNEMLALCASLGADVPFCFIGGCAHAQGIGEILSPCPPLHDVYVCIGRGRNNSSTPEAYSALDRMGIRSHRTSEKMRSSLTRKELPRREDFYNDFERVILQKDADAADIKATLDACGAHASLLCGSGSALFGIFKNEEKARGCCRELKSKGYFSCVCEF